MLILIRLVFSAGLALVAASLALYYSDREAQLAHDLLTHGVPVKATVTDLLGDNCRNGWRTGNHCGARISYSFTDKMGNAHNGAGHVNDSERALLVAGSTEYRTVLAPQIIVTRDRVPVPGATVDIVYRENDPSTNYLKNTLTHWTRQDPLWLGLLAMLFFFFLYYWTGFLASVFLGVPRERWLVWLEKGLGSRKQDIEFLD